MTKKFVTVLLDGMSDFPDKNGKTPMSEAKKPKMDSLMPLSECGLCKTVPDGMKPGSDVANLSVMGYDPAKYYTGRSPIEALSMGVSMKFADVTYRCNLVTLSDEKEYKDKTMLDYSAGEISTEEAAKLIEYLRFTLNLDGFSLYPGVSYRHCLLNHDADTGAILTAPHDISDKKIGEYLPKGTYADTLNALMEQSYNLLTDHPVNIERIKQGKRPANSIWLWGEGRKPALDDFKKMYGVSGAVISAVDLIKGIAIGAGMKVINVKGATGNLNTNFEGKADAAIKALEKYNYLYIHIEAPDECGHQGDFAGKQRAIELIDEKVITPVFDYLTANGDNFSMLMLPDHATPVSLRTHVSDPVPYLLYDSKHKQKNAEASFTEKTAANSGVYVTSGTALLEKLIGKFD